MPREKSKGNIRHVQRDLYVGGNVEFRGPRPWVDVRAYGAVGDNVTDDYVAIVAAYDATPEGGTLFFPDPPGGAYLIGGANTLTFTKRIRILGQGPDTVLRKTGTGDLLVLGQNVAGQQKRGLYVANLTLATEAGAGDALELRAIHSSTFQNILIPSAAGAGIRVKGSILNTFIGVAVSTNLNYLGTRTVPTHGVRLESGENGGGVGGSNANTFLGFHAEGITTSPGVGIDLDDADGCHFYGGASEGNTTGVAWGTGVHHNVVAVYMELNGANEGGIRNRNALFMGVGTDTHIPLGAGTQSLPSLHFDNDPNTGFFAIGADSFAAIVNATRAMEFSYTAGAAEADASGGLRIGSGTKTKKRTSGATSVADGGTVTHSLGTTPVVVRTTPTIASEMVSVTAVGATTFTVAIKKHDNTVGTTQVVYWEAEDQ